MNFKASLIILLFTPFLLFGQYGIISGKITEKNSGMEVIGGTILLKETGNGTISDLDGTYSLKVNPGTYTVEFSYTGFAPEVIKDVKVIPGKVTALDMQLAQTSIDLGVVEITAKTYRNTVSSLLALQKNASVVLDGISAAQISQSGDGDAASAVKRVTGVTVEGGKYVYVRGLGDRYSKTTLNGGEVPGLDPNRNTLQMDLFPSGLIDNIVVYKTFSPNLPGDFSGGYVDISTRDFPEMFSFSVGASTGYTVGTSLNGNFMSYPGGKNDWLGFDDGKRALPAVVTQSLNSFPKFAEGFSNPEKAQQLATLTNEFTNSWLISNKKPPLNHSFSFTIGNQKKLFGKPLGYITALSYQRNFTHYENGDFGIYELTGLYNSSNALTPQVKLTDSKSDDEILWGALLNTSLKVSAGSKIGLTIMHNQSGQSSVRYLEGTKYRDDPSEIFQTRTWDWLERSLSTAQLSGKHVLKGLQNLEIDWLSSASISTQDNPDLRYFTNRYMSDADLYRLKPSSDNMPSRFYRNMEQTELNHKLDLTMPFKQWNGLSSALKAGIYQVTRNRTFRENRFNFNNQSLLLEGNNPYTYFEQDNLIKANTEGFVGYTGVYALNFYDPKNNYDANQTVNAAYLMADLPLTNKFSAVAGVRVEQANVKLRTFDEGITLDRYPNLDGKQYLFSKSDLLPSVNLSYKFTEDMKLRFGYSKTLARPSFRELAPFASFAVDGGFVFVGNPDLKSTLTDNLDLRWELFQPEGDMVSLSLFYKNFSNPIERTFNPEAQNTELTLRNVDNARLYGTEVEMRKSFGFIGSFFQAFALSANFSYIHSETQIDKKELNLIRAVHPEAVAKREMFGQAPYTVNVMLSFDNRKGTKANLTYNVVGERISVVTRGATPDYYQKPQPVLNFNVAYQFESGISIKLSGSNLFNSASREAVNFKGTEYTINSFQPGRSLSFGINYSLSK